MKHGDKAKKSAKGKASGKTASSKVASPGKTSKGAQSRSQASGSKAAPAKTSTKASAKAHAGGNGKTSVARDGTVTFSNPVVGAAFKRAVKKYPTAFRRLTD